MEPQKKPIHLNENDTPYLYEPFRNQMPAKRQHPAEKEKILKPWQGLLVFAFLMVLFNLAGIPLVFAGGSAKRSRRERRKACRLNFRERREK